MNLDVNAITLILTIGAMIWRGGKIEGNLTAKIENSQSAVVQEVDRVKDLLTEQINNMDKTLAVHINDTASQIDALKYRVDRLEAQIDRLVQLPPPPPPRTDRQVIN